MPFGGGNGRGQSGENLKFEALARDRIRQRGEALQGALQDLHGRAVGMHALRRGCRSQVPARGSFGLPGPLIVGRELAADLVRSVVMELLEGARDLQVMVAPESRAEREIGDLADLVVAEVVGVRSLLAHDPAPPELI